MGLVQTIMGFKNTITPWVIFLMLASLFLQCTEKKSVDQKPVKLSFQYEPPQPVNGTLKGIIEIGGDGFNVFAVNIDSLGVWSLEHNTFGKSNIYSNQLNEDSLKLGLEKYRGELLDKNIASKNIYTVISSTVGQSDSIQKIQEILNGTGMKTVYADSITEGQYAMLATIPSSFENHGFVVDIGTGNTKISWIESREIKSLSTHGSRYYTKGVSDKQVEQDIKELLKRLPTQKSSNCFLIGGVPFEMAKTSRTDEERYTVLNNPSSYNFSDPKLKAGLHIYKCIYESAASDHFIFDWHSNFSIGYVINLERKILMIQ